MLVITRKPGQRILVGDAIALTVVKCESGKVRIGIEAPDHVGIRRGELPPLAVVDEIELELETESQGQQVAA